MCSNLTKVQAAGYMATNTSPKLKHLPMAVVASYSISSTMPPLGGYSNKRPPLEYDVIVLHYVSRVNSRGKTLKLVRRVLFSWITLKKVSKLLRMRMTFLNSRSDYMRNRHAQRLRCISYQNVLNN